MHKLKLGHTTHTKNGNYTYDNKIQSFFINNFLYSVEFSKIITFMFIYSVITFGL